MAEANAAEKPKRKRTPREYVVLRRTTDLNYTVEWRGYATARHAEAQLEAFGEAGEVYQVACLVGDPTQVEVETVESRKLKPVE